MSKSSRLSEGSEERSLFDLEEAEGDASPPPNKLTPPRTTEAMALSRNWVLGAGCAAPMKAISITAVMPAAEPLIT